MLKKITGIALSAFLVLGLNSALVAQEEDLLKDFKDPEVIAQMELAFEGQPELTENDVQEYLRLLPEIVAAQGDTQKILATMDTSELGQIRFAYAGVKTSLALILLLKSPGYEEVKTLSEVLQPSENEVNLVAKYQDEAARLTVKDYEPKK